MRSATSFWAWSRALLGVAVFLTMRFMAVVAGDHIIDIVVGIAACRNKRAKRIVEANIALIESTRHRPPAESARSERPG